MKGESEVVLSRGDDDRRVLPGQIAGRSSVVREASSPRESRGSNCGARVILVLGANIPSPCFVSAPNPPKMSTPAATAETAESKAAAVARKKKGTAAATAAVITGGGHHRAAVAPFPIGRGHGAAAATAPSMAGFGAAITASSKAGFGAAAAASAMAGFGTAAASSSMAASGAADSSPIYCRAGKINCLDFHRKEDLLVTSSEDDYIRLYNITSATDNNSHPPGGFMSFLNNQSQSSQNSQQ